MTFLSKWRRMPIAARASVAYAVCSVLEKIPLFITMPLFTRMLTPAQYGQHNIYLSWFNTLALFLTLHLAQDSFFPAMIKFEDQRDEYVSALQGIFLMLTALFMAIYLPLRHVWNRFFELPTYIVCIMVCEILFSNATQLWKGRKRFAFQYKSVVALTLLVAFLSPIITYFFVACSDEKGYARIVGMAFLPVAVGLLLFVQNLSRGKKLFNRKFWKYALGFHIPLLVYYLSHILLNQSDRILISHLCGTDKVALYGIAVNLATLLSLTLGAVNNAYLPWFYGKIKAGCIRENRPVSCVIAALMALLLLAVIWYTPEFFLIMTDTEYYEAIYAVAPIAVGMMLQLFAQMFINVQFYFEEKKTLVFASAATAAANIILNLWLLPIFGYIAASYTQMLSYLIFAGANFIAYRKLLRKKGLTDEAYNYPVLMGILLVFMAAAFLGMALYHTLSVRIVITIIVLAITGFMMPQIFQTFKELKNK